MTSLPAMPLDRVDALLAALRRIEEAGSEASLLEALVAGAVELTRSARGRTGSGPAAIDGIFATVADGLVVEVSGGTYDETDRLVLDRLAAAAGRARARIRERESLQAALDEARNAREHFVRLLTQAPALVNIQRGPEHVYEFVHPIGTAMLGGRDVTGRKQREVFTHPDTEPFNQLFDHVYATGETVRREEMPGAIPRPDGTFEPRTFDVTLLPWREADGRVAGVMTFSVDVTEKVRSRKVLEEQREWLQGMLDLLPIPLLLLDLRTGAMRFTNRATAAMSGVEIPVGSTPAERAKAYLITDEHDRPVPPERLAAARAANGEVYEAEPYVWHTPKGRVSLLVSCGQLPALGDHPASAVVVMQDVSALRRTENALKEAISARDLFLSMASHELRTPLTAAILQAETMGRLIVRGDPRAAEPARIARFVHQSRSSLARLERLVDDMLDISRIQLGKLVLQREDVDLAELVRDVLERFSGPLDEVGMDVTTRLEPVPGRWDRMRLEQIVVNLLTNAMRHAPRAPLSVEVRAVGERALLVVQDGGPGIAAEHRERVFQRFERLAADDRTGLGLGLYIVSEFVRAHGGTVTLESELGRGSRFTVELPR